MPEFFEALTRTHKTLLFCELQIYALFIFHTEELLQGSSEACTFTT